MWYEDEVVEEKKAAAHIPIGFFPASGNQVMFEVPLSKTGKPMSMTVMVVGQTGTGKTVTSSTIAHGLSQHRPVIWIDCPGKDHYHNYKPTTGKNTAPGTTPRGFKARYIVYPNIVREKAPYEKEVRPYFGKYSTSDLKNLGFTESAARTVKVTINENPDLKTMDHLKKSLERAYVRSDVKKVLLEHLDLLIGLDYYTMDPKKALDWYELFESGESAVVSIKNAMIAKAEISYALKQVELYRNKVPQGHRPFIWIEEAHKMYTEDISNFITVCPKDNVGLGLCMAQIPDNMTKEDIGDIRHFIASNVRKATFEVLKDIMNDHPRSLDVKYLPLRHWSYYNGWPKGGWAQEPYLFAGFQNYEPACEVHRRDA